MTESLNVKRILIVNIFGLGDVLFTTPLISNIKQAFPDAYVGYVCNRRTVSLLESNPKVDKVFVYEKDEYIACAKRSPLLLLKKVLGFLKEIKGEKFDAAIDLSLYKYSSFFLWGAGIKRRIGYNFKNRSPFLTDKFVFKRYEGRHVIEYYLALLGALGIPAPKKKMEYVIPARDLRWAQEFLKANRIGPRDMTIAVVPGGGESWGKDASLKRWSVPAYAGLIDNLIEKFGAKIILLGSDQEQKLCEEVKALARGGIVLAGTTNVHQFGALLSHCALAVVNDGGPLHVAVAVGTKTVSIFGPVDENIYGPYPQEGHTVVTKDIPCRPCYRNFRVADCSHRRCLRTITVADVLSAVEQTLKRI